MTSNTLEAEVLAVSAARDAALIANDGPASAGTSDGVAYEADEWISEVSVRTGGR